MDSVRVGMDLEQELGMDLSRPDGTESWMKDIGRGPVMTVPPEPPAKDLPGWPAPLKLGTPTPIGSPSQPPNRPLPPTPAARSSESPRVPQPSRPPPFRPQGPLSMNPPTRPGTAASQESAATSLLRLPGSTKQLSWNSIASRRPIKYGQGNHGRVELVPQPSDEPDDPLVRAAQPSLAKFVLIIFFRTGLSGGKSSTFGPL